MMTSVVRQRVPQIGHSRIRMSPRVSSVWEVSCAQRGFGHALIHISFAASAASMAS